MARPSTSLAWAGSGTKTDPGSSFRVVGWPSEGYLPPYDYFNWWQNLAGQWAEYTKEWDSEHVEADGKHANVNAYTVEVEGPNRGYNARVGGFVDVETAAVNADDNLSTEQSVGSYIIPAGELSVGTVIRVRASVRVTASSGPPALTIRLKVGTLVVLNQSWPGTPAVGSVMHIDSYWTVRAVGVSPNAEVECMTTVLEKTSTTVTPDMGRVSLTTGLDTTAANAVSLTAQWGSSGSGNNDVQMEQFVVEWGGRG